MFIWPTFKDFIYSMLLRCKLFILKPVTNLSCGLVTLDFNGYTDTDDLEKNKHVYSRTTPGTSASTLYTGLPTKNETVKTT